MKHIFPAFLSIILLCLTGCQLIEGTVPKTEIPSDDSSISNEMPSQNDNVIDFEPIPILFCNFEDKSISVGNWDVAKNEFVIPDDGFAGTTEDPYTLYSLRWDGDKKISGLQVYLDEINHFNGSLVLQPKRYGEFIKNGVSIIISDNGEPVLNIEDKSHIISGTDVIIDNIGQVTPVMMTGVAFSIDEEVAFYLQSLMTEDGVYLICSTIDMSTMDAESYIINSDPYVYDEIDMGTFGEDAFAEENGVIYFYTKNVVYSFTPKTKEVSKVIFLEGLNLPSDDPDTRFQISGVTVYDGNVLVECAEYVTDIPNSKTSFLCSPTGEVLQSIKWNCSEELAVFPKT